MLKNLNGIKFIGDLSLQDADILADYAKKSKSILEFGAGGSTQIMSQCKPEIIICVETDPSWAELTSSRLQKISNPARVDFVNYKVNFDKQFDLIFVDGVSKLRTEFAINTWKNLNVGGVMIFHDTRVESEFERLIQLSKNFYLEIEKIEVNAKASDGKSSNMTIIHKKENEPYVNWNKTEGKPSWSYGGFGMPEQDLWEYNF